MSLAEDQTLTIKHLREMLAEAAAKNERLQAALDRVLAECKVSTDRDFYEHVKNKAERIVNGQSSEQKV